MLAWDRRATLRPLALQDPRAAGVLPELTPQERMASWHLVEDDGTVHSGGAAFVPLGRLLPAGRALSLLAARFPRATERAYRWVADHRSALGSLVSDGAKARAQRRIDARG